MSLVEGIIHSLAVLNYIYTIYFQYALNIPEEVSKNRNKFGGAVKYLTFWNLFVQLAFHVAALLSPKYRRLGKVRDFLFASLAFPVGVLVGGTFWGIYWIDRELILPVRFDKYISPLQNHGLHSAVLILMAFELATRKHNYPTRKSGIRVTVWFFLAYLSWVFYIAYAGGFWVYPVLKVLSPAGRTGFIAALGVAAAMLYLMGEKLNKLVWPERPDKRID